MQFVASRPSARRRKIDMTPMIDCVFQLLLFFLVVSQFEDEARLTTEGELAAKLPAVASAMPMVMKPKEMIINVDHWGRYVVSGQIHVEAELSTLLRRAEINNPGRQSIVIRGDERADWKYVARVMSLCNQAHIKDYRVAVIPSDKVPEDN